MPSLAKQVTNAAKMESILSSHLREIIQVTDRNMTAFDRHVTRRTISSMRPYVADNHGIIEGSSSFLALERGRKGGKIPYGFWGILKEWVLNRGIATDNREAGSIAYFIMQKIKSEGSKMHRDGTVQDIFSTAVETELEKLAEELLYSVSSDIDYLHQQISRT